MLRKLFAYELKTTSRQYIPMYLVYFALSIVNMLFFEHGFMRLLREEGLPDMLSIISFLISCLYIICMIAVYVLTYVFIIVNFYQTTAGKRGYFTFSLPVRTSTILHCKLLMAIFWQLISLAVIVLSVHMLCAFHGMPNWFFLLKNIFASYSPTFFEHYSRIFVISILFGVLFSPLQFFTPIAIGQLFSKNRIAWSICFYFVIYTIQQILGSILLFLQNFTGIIMGLTQNLISLDEYLQYLTSMLWEALALNFILTAVLYGIIQYVYTKKLNLT